jgi:proline dehydrogenase
MLDPELFYENLNLKTDSPSKDSDVKPSFPLAWLDVVAQGANALRALALNEAAKQKVADDPSLLQIARRISDRFIGGENDAEALVTLKRIEGNGHQSTVDYMGESCRDPQLADSETDCFLRLIDQLDQQKLNSSISLDLSHIGSAISFEQGLSNAVRIANRCKQSNREMIISMEGHDRVDITLDIYQKLSEQFSNVGITIQARLHRTKTDLPPLLALPGKIRLVKGAYLAGETIAFARDSDQLQRAYREYAFALINSGHLCSIATHDAAIIRDLSQHLQQLPSPADQVEFEMLLGLGGTQLDQLKQSGYKTREYVVYGKEWFLYVCNRIAEEPVRVYQALVDAMGTGANQ